MDPGIRSLLRSHRMRGGATYVRRTVRWCVSTVLAFFDALGETVAALSAGTVSTAVPDRGSVGRTRGVCGARALGAGVGPPS
ncbi:hypothetical protein C7M71_000725 [Peterkaempfera bronchialis]|uniref:Uncharacterized protein n=1 Tax=Peterkaempfera bronchialis TaxID=2126346 RepID=A0A345SR63_9ACTN|nr:hypothetical protein C7M71_000725 [Peterkaempfera bronchialis]